MLAYHLFQIIHSLKFYNAKFLILEDTVIYYGLYVVFPDSIRQNLYKKEASTPKKRVKYFSATSRFYFPEQKKQQRDGLLLWKMYEMIIDFLKERCIRNLSHWINYYETIHSSIILFSSNSHQGNAKQLLYTPIAHSFRLIFWRLCGS